MKVMNKLKRKIRRSLLLISLISLGLFQILNSWASCPDEIEGLAHELNLQLRDHGPSGRNAADLITTLSEIKGIDPNEPRLILHISIRDRSSNEAWRLASVAETTANQLGVAVPEDFKTFDKDSGYSFVNLILVGSIRQLASFLASENGSKLMNGVSGGARLLSVGHQPIAIEDLDLSNKIVASSRDTFSVALADIRAHLGSSSNPILVKGPKLFIAMRSDQLHSMRAQLHRTGPEVRDADASLWAEGHREFIDLVTKGERELQIQSTEAGVPSISFISVREFNDLIEARESDLDQFAKFPKVLTAENEKLVIDCADGCRPKAAADVSAPDAAPTPKSIDSDLDESALTEQELVRVRQEHLKSSPASGIAYYELSVADATVNRGIVKFFGTNTFSLSPQVPAVRVTFEPESSGVLVLIVPRIARELGLERTLEIYSAASGIPKDRIPPQIHEFLEHHLKEDGVAPKGPAVETSKEDTRGPRGRTNFTRWLNEHTPALVVAERRRKETSFMGSDKDLLFILPAKVSKPETQSEKPTSQSQFGISDLVDVLTSAATDDKAFFQSPTWTDRLEGLKVSMNSVDPNSLTEEMRARVKGLTEDGLKIWSEFQPGGPFENQLSPEQRERIQSVMTSAQSFLQRLPETTVPSAAADDDIPTPVTQPVVKPKPAGSDDPRHFIHIIPVSRSSTRDDELKYRVLNALFRNTKPSPKDISTLNRIDIAADAVDELLRANKTWTMVFRNRLAERVEKGFAGLSTFTDKVTGQEAGFEEITNQANAVYVQSRDRLVLIALKPRREFNKGSRRNGIGDRISEVLGKKQ